MARMGHNGLVGMRYHGHGADWAELALDHRADLEGDAGAGTVARGPVFTTMDMAMSISVWLRAGVFRPQATVDLRVDWTGRAERGRTVHVRGECYARTATIAFVRGIAHDGDAARPFAHAVGSYIFT